DPGLTLACRADLLVNKSDTNVAEYVARQYREQGDSFVSRLRGTFAIILYDHENRILKAWTDHFGAERLVFAECGDSLAISTDIGWLLRATSQTPSIDPSAIREYLQYTCIPTPKTIYAGVYKLASGHQLTSRPSLTTQPYWDMVYEESGSGQSFP